MTRLATFLQALKALPTAAAAILLIVPQTKQAIGSLLSMNGQDVALLAIVLVAYTIIILFTMSTTRSTLPARGLLVQLTQADPVAIPRAWERESDVITYQCLHYQQVFLVGTAGVGKTTRINMLLLKKLRLGNGVLPIYVANLESCGGGAEQTALATALWAALEEPQRAKFSAGAGPEPNTVFDALDQMYAANLLPLIIFDHFDDYLGASLNWITEPGTIEGGAAPVNASLSANDLRAKSPFWENVARRVAADKLKTIYVTTPDMIAFVSSFRFGTRIIQSSLFELQIADVDLELSGLESSLQKEGHPVMFPDNGWTALRRRLVADLAPRQTCLPHQFVAAVQGLATLPYITPDVYDARGGLMGLCSLALEGDANEIASDEVPTELSAALGPNVFGAESARDWQAEFVLLICAALASRPHSLSRIVATAHKFIPPNSLFSPASVEDPRWKVSLQRLQARRLVRLRRETLDREEVYELRHPYVGAAAKVALQRRAPLYAELVRRSSAHGAATTMAEWWNTLLPVPRQVRLWYARLTSPFRFDHYRRYVSKSSVRLAVWVGAAVGYVLLADWGVALPFGDALRLGLDSVGLTLFRQPADPSVSIASLRSRGIKVADEIVNRCAATSWCNSLDGNAELHPEPWSTAQALAAVFANSETKAASAGWAHQSLQTVIDSKYKIVVKGRTEDWTLGALSDAQVSEPTLWLGIALAHLSANHHRSAQMIADLPHWNKEVASAFQTYARGSSNEPAPFIEFPTEVPGNGGVPANIYATSLALLRYVEIARFDHGADVQVRQIAKWLLEHRHPRGRLDPAEGWQPADYPAESIYAGVTLQVLYALMRARGVVPDAVPQNIDEIAIKWINHSLEEHNLDRQDVAFTYGDYVIQDETKHYGHVVRYMWFPWAIGTALELQHVYEKSGSNAKRLAIARALDHYYLLAEGVLTEAEIHKRATYMLSEFAYVMGSES
jgi:hypothetical protein